MGGQLLGDAQRTVSATVPSPEAAPSSVSPAPAMGLESVVVAMQGRQREGRDDQGKAGACRGSCWGKRQRASIGIQSVMSHAKH
jgi:hypothetical protein